MNPDAGVRSPGVARRLLLLHAHPDDESIMTGGTIARYLAAGVDVRVVTFTLGEQGEVIGDQWAHLVAEEADQLGGYRIHELTRALAALTPQGRPAVGPRFLGGAGRWRDSGMAGTPSAAHPRALAQGPFDAVVDAVAAEIVDFDPQVVLTYDDAGTYGHPDHMTVHAATVAALPLVRARVGTEPAVYESVTERATLDAGLHAAAGRVPAGWRMPGADELPSYPAAQITTAIDVASVYERKVAALAAHATQITVSPSGTEYALSNNVLQPIMAVEHFILANPAACGVDRHAADTDAVGHHTDFVWR